MPYSAQVLVRFRRIDRMYDLRFGPHNKGATRILPARDQSPHPHIFDPVEDQRDENGRVIKSFDQVKLPAPRSGIYRSYWVSGLPHVLRTFVRGPSCEPPRQGAWVYVLSDQHARGEFRLVHILHYRDHGKYTQRDLDAPERDLEEQPEDALLCLWEVNLGTPVRNCAFLSPIPLPAAAIKALREPSSDKEKTLLANVLRRASWLNDPFVCDIARGSNSYVPAEKQAEEAAKDGATPVGERVLYLLNPFHEAEARIDAFQDSIHAALEAQQKAAEDPRYLFAKRVQAASTGNERLASLVQPTLDKELAEVEDPISYYSSVAEERAADLLRWCGYPYEPSGWTWFDGGIAHHTWKVDARPDGSYTARALTYEMAPQQTGLANALSAAMLEAHGLSDEWKEAIDDVRDRAHSDLDQTEVGRKFLSTQVARILEKEPIRPGSDDGLLGVLWVKGEKNVLNLARRGWSGVFQNLLPSLYLAQGKATFKWLEGFIKHRTGDDLLNLGVVDGRVLRTVTAEEAELAARLRAKHGPEYDTVRARAQHLFNDKPKDLYQRQHQMGKIAAQPWIILFQLTLFFESLDEHAKHPSAWNKVAIASNFLSIVDTTADLTLEFLKEKRLRILRKLTLRDYTLRVPGMNAYVGYARLRFIGTLASALDLVLAIRATTSERYPGVRAGRVLRAVGAAAAMVGGITAETGVGVIFALVGLGLQFAGDIIAYLYEPLRVFLLKTPWGRDGTKDPTKAQLLELNRELDMLLYSYSWEVRTEPAMSEGLVRIFLDVTPTRGSMLLPREATLDVNLALTHETRPPKTASIATSIGYGSLCQSEVWAILLAEIAWAEAAHSYQVLGTLSLRLDARRLRYLDARVEKTAATFVGNSIYTTQERPDGGVPEGLE
jgi:hypothetical protein